MGTNLLDDLFNSDLSYTVTYKHWDSSSFVDGKNVDNYSDYSVSVIKSDTALEAQAASTILAAMSFESGQLFYLIKQSDMPRDPFSKDILKDIIVDDGKEHQLKKAVPIHGVLVKVKC